MFIIEQYGVARLGHGLQVVEDETSQGLIFVALGEVEFEILIDVIYLKTPAEFPLVVTYLIFD